MVQSPQESSASGVGMKFGSEGRAAGRSIISRPRGERRGVLERGGGLDRGRR